MNAMTDNKLMFPERRWSETWRQVRRFTPRLILWTFATLGVILTGVLIFDAVVLAIVLRMP